MRKLILFFVAVLFAANVSAERGNMVLSGSIGVSGWSDDTQQHWNSTASSFSIVPNFQYFLTDRFSLGLETGFQILKRKSEREATEHVEEFYSRTSTNVFNVGIFGRYYFLKTQRFGVFGQAGVRAGFANNEDSWYGSSSIHAAITPGVQYFINSRWSIETRLSPIFRFDLQRWDSETGRNGTRIDFWGDLNHNWISSFAVNFHF